jgi:hypothetical protein
MVRRTTLVIRKVRTTGIANSLALVSTEIFFFEEIMAKADRRPAGQRCTPHLRAQWWFE